MSELDELFPELENIRKLKTVYSDLIDVVSQGSKKYNDALDEIVDSTKKAKEQLEKLNPSIKDNQDEIEKLSNTVDKNVQSYKNLKTSIKSLDGDVDNLTKEQKEFNKKAEETLQINKERIKLQNKLSQLNSEEAKDIAKLKVQIQEKNKELKKNAQETLGVTKVQSLFSKNQELIAQALGNTGPAFQAASTGGRGLLTTFNAILANPIGLLIAAIVAGLAFLFNAFTKTVGGAEKLEQALSAVGAIFDTLTRQIGKLITGEISFLEFLSQTTDELEKNVDAALDLVSARRALEQQTAKNTIEEAKLAKSIEKLRGIRDNDLISLKIRLDAAKTLEKEEAKLAQSRIDQAVREAQIAGQALAVLGVSQEEITKAIEKRSIASLQAAAVDEESRKQINEFAGVLAGIIDAETELATVRAETAQQTSTLILDLLDQELDFLIDIDEKRLDSNNKILESDRTTAKQRETLFLRQQEIIDSSLGRQIQTFQDYLGIQIDFQKLISLSGKEAFEYAQSLGLAERAAIRLIEITKGSQTAQEDLNKAFAKFRKEQNQVAEIAKKTGEEVQKPIKNLRTVTIQTTTTVLQDLQGFLANVAQIFGKSADAVFNLFSSIRNRRNEENQQEIQQLEERTRKQLENENLTAKQREAILTKENQQRQRLQREQAQRNRRLAVFNKALAISESIIQTALQVVKLGIITPQAILAGVLGGIQTGAIIAQPIPAFAKGTRNAPGGVAIVGEEGRELILEPSGKVSLTGNRAELRDVPQGSTVLTNAITERILSGDTEVYRNSGSAQRIQKAIQIDRANVINRQIQSIVRSQNSDLVEAIKSIIPEVHEYEFVNGKLQHNIRKGNIRYIDVKNENSY